MALNVQSFNTLSIPTDLKGLKEKNIRSNNEMSTRYLPYDYKFGSSTSYKRYFTNNRSVHQRRCLIVCKMAVDLRLIFRILKKQIMGSLYKNVHDNVSKDNYRCFTKYS